MEKILEEIKRMNLQIGDPIRITSREKNTEIQDIGYFIGTNNENSLEYYTSTMAVRNKDLCSPRIPKTILSQNLALIEKIEKIKIEYIK